MMKHLQHGYVGPALLYFTTFLICILLAAVPSCGSSANCADPKNAASASCLPADVSACAQAEAKLIAAGQSVAQYTVGVIAKLTAAYVSGGPTAVLAAIAAMITSDGEQLVSCVVSDYTSSNPIPLTVTPASGSGSGSAAPVPSLLDVLRGVVADKKWPLAPAKK